MKVIWIVSELFVNKQKTFLLKSQHNNLWNLWLPIMVLVELGTVHKRCHQSRWSYFKILFSKSDDEGGGGQKFTYEWPLTDITHLWGGQVSLKIFEWIESLVKCARIHNMKLKSKTYNWNILLGAVHKLCRQARGRGVGQMSMLQHKLM